MHQCKSLNKIKEVIHSCLDNKGGLVELLNKCKLSIFSLTTVRIESSDTKGRFEDSSLVDIDCWPQLTFFFKPLSAILSSSSLCQVISGLSRGFHSGLTYIVAHFPSADGSGHEVHFLELSGNDTLECILEIPISGSLMEHSDFIWKITRCIFHRRPDHGECLHPTLTSALLVDESSPEVCILYLLMVLGFLWPFYDWDRVLSRVPPIETPLCAFWCYIAPFVLNRFSRLHCCSDRLEVNFLTEFRRLCMRLSVPTVAGQGCLQAVRFLESTSFHGDSTVLDVVGGFLLPHVDDASDFISHCSTSLRLDIMQSQALCTLLSDFDPRFITALFGSTSLLQAHMRDLVRFSGIQGDNEISQWLRFALPLYQDCLYQLRDDSPDVRCVFQVKGTGADRLIAHEVECFLRRQRTAELCTASLALLARRACRGALRRHLDRTPLPRCALSQYIEQLPVPAKFKCMLLSNGCDTSTLF
ncbi:unnamed protein product [Mesocestoides corti]|uniref:Mab-21 domain-containing protein n=1 Tax=Mesocestoides corti TaxID=53468 RepID=A0A0R3U9P2_MESCO|nr:unnamed protein product [Mesocestoides corti]